MGTEVAILLAGDVMTGRGVDQVLAHPGRPVLREEMIKDARGYVELAEHLNGPIGAPVPDGWPWGEVLALAGAPEVTWRVMNLETSVTRSDDWAPGKAVHYRMNPDNVGCLRAPGTDVWALANNHVLDFGERGLRETLDVLRAAGQRTAGAGRDAAEAWRPALVGSAGRRLLVWAVGHGSSGVPADWAATADRPGVAVLPDLTDATADALTARVAEVRRPGDLVVVSVHWGGNWGYAVAGEQRRFAHRLVDAGVHVVHGHSSHHPRAAEAYRGGLVLYGCGDLVNDYEGIGGYEGYRDDLRLVHLARFDPDGAGLLGLRMVPLRVRRMRLEPAAPAEARWLAHRLGLGLGDDGTLSLTTP